MIILFSIVCLILEVDTRLAFLALVRPIKLLRYFFLCHVYVHLKEKLMRGRDIALGRGRERERERERERASFHIYNFLSQTS